MEKDLFISGRFGSFGDTGTIVIIMISSLATLTTSSITHHFSPFNRSRPSQTGFTLVEILVALFIFSIIVTTVFGSYRFVFGNSDTISGNSQLEEMALNCLERMTRDLEGIQITPALVYRKPDTKDNPDPFRFEGELITVGDSTFPRIRFASLEHVSVGPDRDEGIAEIVYYVMVEEDSENRDVYRYVLRRSDRLDYGESFEESMADPILCESLRSLQVTYIGTDDEDHDHWNSEAEDNKYATPVGVSIELEIGNDTLYRQYHTKVFLPVRRDAVSE